MSASNQIHLFKYGGGAVVSLYEPGGGVGGRCHRKLAGKTAEKAGGGIYGGEGGTEPWVLCLENDKV